MFTPEQIKELEAPLSRANVKEREQAGRKFSYIEAYHAENEANRIFGFSAWDRFTDYELIAEREQDGKHRVYYRAKVKIVVRSEGGEVTTREGCGYGSGIDKDIGQAHESALKEAESDAEKRALKTFGNPFGQALYDKAQTQVETPQKAKAPDFKAAIASAKAAIDLAADLDTLRKWRQDNAKLFNELDTPSANDVIRHMNARVETLKAAELVPA